MQTVSDKSYIHKLDINPLVYRNIGEHFDIAVERFSSVEAIVSCHENIRLTYKDLRDEADKFGVALLKIGLKEGDVIAVWGPNTINWYITMLAAARTGLILLGLNPAFREREIQQCLTKVEVKVIVTPYSYKTQNYYEILKNIIPDIVNSKPGKLVSKSIPTLEHIIIDSNEIYPTTWNFNEMMHWANDIEIQNLRENIRNINPDSACNIQLTSGTTGMSKAVLLSHFNIVNNSIDFGTRISMYKLRLCCQIPFFHAYAIICAIFAAYEYGSTLVLPSASFDANFSLKAIDKEKCAVIYGTPTMYVDLINKQKLLGYDMCPSAKYAITAGAPCSPQLFEDIEYHLNLKKVNTLYGLSETSAGVFISLPIESKENIIHTVGCVLENQEVKVVDDKGYLVPFGTPGELHVRGYRNMMGYYGDKESTQNTIGKDGWLRTGDQFILREDGYGIIVGRLKDLIIRGGENIYPKEIEDFLNTHMDVLEAYVVGIPDERMGEELCAFIRTVNGSELDENTLKQFCVGKIARFKIPKYIRIIVEFPKTATGKIQKYKLKDLF